VSLRVPLDQEAQESRELLASSELPALEHLFEMPPHRFDLRLNNRHNYRE
jgi:hypothetical protein